MFEAVADPDLQIRRGGGEGAVSKKNFPPFGPQFGLKIRGAGGPPDPFPGSATVRYPWKVFRGSFHPEKLPKHKVVAFLRARTIYPRVKRLMVPGQLW